MAPLPSAIRGNLVANSEQILLRAPSFETFCKSSYHVQHKPLQLERRFSHYEQKVMTSRIDKLKIKLPRRLQTRKIERTKRETSFQEDKIKWNERLAAWIRDDQPKSLNYIKISDQYNLIEKQIYFCSSCHEFFHVNLREREERKVNCPRFKDHHDVHPVSITKVKKSDKKHGVKLPPTIVKDPFADRKRNLVIPSLLPPKPIKKPIRVIVEVPRLPVISRSTVASNITSARRSKTFEIPEKREVVETTTNSRTKSTPKLPDIFQARKYDEELPSEEVSVCSDNFEDIFAVETFDDLLGEETEEVDVDQESFSAEIEIEEDDIPLEDESIVGGEEDTGSIQACSDVEMLLDSISEEIDLIDIQSSTYSGEEEEFESDSLPSIPSSNEVSPDLPSETRPRPPPPDLPVVRLQESPDVPTPKPVNNTKKRDIIFLPVIQSEPQEIQPRESPSSSSNSKRSRLTAEELAKRMGRAREIEGFRQKYSHEFSTDYGTTGEREKLETPPETNLYDDSFLQKYSLLSPDHIEKCKRIFNKYDYYDDGYLSCDEVINAIHKMFSPSVLDDVHMCYIVRILETANFDVFTDKMNLKLFAIVTALAQKISKLNKHMKHLIGRVNVEVSDWKICQARRIFEGTVKKDGNGNFKMPIQALWLELQAGGISREHEIQARRTLKDIKEMDILDFMAYLPLFLMIHSQIIENPLNDERTI